jgi:PPOX class probable F420-dependent enzyme
VRLDAEEAWSLLRTCEHGVLATVHAERGVDAVPVVFAVDGRRLLLPVDTVKAKSTTQLQRLANLAGDPRCVLLVDHYDEDWSELWWVRVHGTATVIEARDEALTRFVAYHDDGAVVATIVLQPDQVTGWRAG